MIWNILIIGRGIDKDQQACSLQERPLIFFVMYLPPLKTKACAAHNYHTVRNIYQVKWECRMQEGPLLLVLFVSSYLPWENF